MKLRSLSNDWRIRHAPRPNRADRRAAGVLRKSQIHARDIVTEQIGLTEPEIRKLYSRLSKAADKFWPFIDRDERAERVASTVFEAMERLKKGDKHTISWWAKYMWGTALNKLRANKEDNQDPQADDLWAGSVRSSQEDYVECRQVLRLCALLPEPYRTAILLRADGANPIEIADEMKMTVDRIIDVLGDARHWLSNGGIFLGRPEDRERTA